MNKGYDITEGKDGKQSITIRESGDDDTSKTITVKECENGFYVTIDRSYYEGEGENKTYKYESKSFISKENPFEKKEKEPTSSDIVDSLSGYLQKYFNKFSI